MTGRGVRALAIVLLCLALAACGWQLRGSAGPSLDGRGIQIVDNAGATELRRAVERGVESAGGRVVDQAREGDLVLTLYGEGDSRRTLSVDPGGEVIEYELAYHVAYSVSDAAGETLIPRRRAESDRAYPRESAQQARQRRAELVEELREDTVRLMLLRVQIL